MTSRTSRLALGPALGALVSLAPGPAHAQPRDDKSALLTFENCGAGSGLIGWGGGPPETLFLERQVVHSGSCAGRIERAAGRSDSFSPLSTSVPLDFAGSRVELRGFLRLENVSDRAALWLRQDGPSGMLALDNMQGRSPSGTSDWAEYSVSLPIDPRATRLVFGALLSGSGRLLVDDLRLLVDGRPFAEAPPRAIPKTILDTDREFDASSGIDVGRLTPGQLDALFALGKLWGYLKYHHPRVVKGELHWDYELFRVLPRVLSARSRGDWQTLLSRWVAGLGATPPCNPCAESPAGRPVLPRLGWLSDRRLLGRDLAEALPRVHGSRAASSQQFYLSFAPGVGNPDFGREAAYPGKELPDAGFRLLSLFRVWNIIEYWFPYRDVMEEDWDAVLREMLPLFVAAATKDDFELALMRLFVRVHDGHAAPWSSLAARPPRGECQLPIQVRFVEGQATATGYTSAALGPATGIEIGDVIRSLDGKRVDDLLALWRPLYSASNQAARSELIGRSLTKGPCGAVPLEVDRGGKALSLTAERAPGGALDLRQATRHDHPGAPFRRLSDDVAYLTLASVKAADASEYVRRAAGAKLLVIDIRNYPSEFVVFALGRHLVSRKTEFARFTVADGANPGSFVWGVTVSLDPAEPRFEGRVAILVDETSLSQAEYTTMAFRVAPGAVVVGSTTAGADGNVSRIPLPGGRHGMITGIGVFYPDRRPTQRIGIVPDVVARPTRAGVRAGLDEVLEAAVREILRRGTTEAERAALRATPPATQ